MNGANTCFKERVKGVYLPLRAEIPHPTETSSIFIANSICPITFIYRIVLIEHFLNRIQAVAFLLVEALFWLLKGSLEEATNIISEKLKFHWSSGSSSLVAYLKMLTMLLYGNRMV